MPLFLVEKLSIGVGTEKRISHLRQIVVGNHIQTGLKGVVHLNFALTSQKLNTSGTEKNMSGSIENRNDTRFKTLPIFSPTYKSIIEKVKIQSMHIA